MGPHRMDDPADGQQAVVIGRVQFSGGPWGARYECLFVNTFTHSYGDNIFYIMLNVYDR